MYIYYIYMCVCVCVCCINEGKKAYVAVLWNNEG